MSNRPTHRGRSPAGALRPRQDLIRSGPGSRVPRTRRHRRAELLLPRTPDLHRAWNGAGRAPGIWGTFAVTAAAGLRVSTGCSAARLAPPCRRERARRRCAQGRSARIGRRRVRTCS
ncbi:hypothetical protein HBB16_11060 [Pseudonocardia sp. MCCB 268]|nr:hypothetical protein [Pseudonocardia cytotoxica]